jgi:hypothetical protein
MTEPAWTAPLESVATGYAAIVATLAFGLEIRRWLKEAPRLDVSLVPDGVVIGGDPGDDEDNLMVVYVVNRGGASTTLENLFLFEFESGLSRWRRRPKRSFIVANPQLKDHAPNLPSLLDPNQRWTGIIRNGRIGFDPQTGDFYVGIGASHSKRPILTRIPQNPFSDRRVRHASSTRQPEVR